MVLVVHLGRTEDVESADFVECLEVHVEGGRNAVLGQELADGAVLSLTRRPVVAPDVEHQRVVATAQGIDLSTIRPTWTSTCSAKPAATSMLRR